MILALIAGCGHTSGVPLANVSGRATFYGRPVPIEIIFQPETDDRQLAGRPSVAVTDADGYYTLGFTQEEQGAVIGRQRVTLKVLPFADGGEPATMTEAVTPLKTTRVLREVRPGNNRFDFALTY